MPQKSYPITEHSNRRVNLKWGFAFRNLVVDIDGQELGSFAKADEIVNGKTWTLDDGKRLFVKLHKAAFVTEMRVFVDDVPVPGSPTDPLTRLKHASNLAFVVGILSIVVSTLFLSLSRNFDDAINWYVTIGMGAVFLGCGIGIRKASVVALVIAISCLTLDTVSNVYFFATEGQNPGGAFIVIRLLLFVGFSRGFPAIKEYKNRRIVLENSGGHASSGNPISIALGEQKE